jgi:predicted CXXCH cytochrome family protein
VSCESDIAMKAAMSPTPNSGIRKYLLALASHPRTPLILTLSLSALVAISCSTLTRTILAPPTIAGAEFVGTKACAECHADLVKEFPTSTHSRLMAEGANAKNIGCESCHGPGSLHIQTGGAAHTMVNPGKSPSVCFQCHLDTRGQFNLASHHPVIEGKVSCSDCHEPHKGSSIRGGGTSLATEQDSCARCHVAQAGPYVFEHEAVREGCNTCHTPHGSVNQKLLVSRDANLCVKCHFQQQTTPGRVFIGGRDHTAFLSRGTCWTAGCHEAVHGSHIGSSLRF